MTSDSKTLDTAPTCPFCGQPQAIRLDTAGQRTHDPALAVFSVVPKFHDCTGGLAAERKLDASRETADRQRQVERLIQPFQGGKYATYKFATWRLDDPIFDDTARQMARQVYDKTRLYVDAVSDDKTRRWLWMHGRYGAGKTHLAVAAVREIAARRLWRPAAEIWPDFCIRVQSSWNLSRGENGETEGKLVGRMRAAQILLIDDIDKIEAKPWMMQKLFPILDFRLIHNRPTIITANHSIHELSSMWQSAKSDVVGDTGNAILSRVAGELAAVVDFSGLPDHRKK